ncbi:hypothetical protein M422DRAFT_51281 [Sphaerobolus stellatus SS14]|uniref:Uncharacterized protein n=1 Tax=Sphaerobolus stellatus (strain SS14) TaxID=990650 RepID=A0A0C9V2S6_SPHS4|nr:hypothetical protein M422DRAFT_51281 [Sphaerobolus stellatus SS14]
MCYDSPEQSTKVGIKLKGSLSHCQEFGSHMLGGVLSLKESEVHSADDIESIIKQVIDLKLLANQVRILIGKVPLPGCPPVVLAALPTKGADGAEDNAALLLKTLELCGEANLQVLSASGDGASAEVKAHEIVNAAIDKHKTYITFSLPKYGLDYKAPVFKTGPFVAIRDTGHVCKVLQDNEQAELTV